MVKSNKLVKARLNSVKADIVKNVHFNGLESFIGDMLSPNPFTPQVNRIDTIFDNLRLTPLTFQRSALTYIYQEQGIIRSAIDQPVDDALRGGVDIKSDELSPEDLEALHEYMENNEIYEVIKTSMKWAELFGGGGIVINNGQDPSTPINLKDMNEKSPLKFYDCDRWELCMPNAEGRPEEYGMYSSQSFYYYNITLHQSRVLRMKGDTAPSLTRRMLMGWGLSKVEKMVRELNPYIKAINLIFELLDEAKVDVYKLEGYKEALSTVGGEAKLQKAIGLTNSTKNYLNALMLDKNDDYEQKQLTFSGLAEMLKEIRIGCASTLRMPVTKLFGVSAAGFNSGEDDIENYNAMIESDVRSRMKPIIRKMIMLCCLKVFGYAPAFKWEYKSLRVSKPQDEETIKTQKQQRILANVNAGMMTKQEGMQAQRNEGLLSIEKSSVESGIDIEGPDNTDNQDNEDDKDKEDKGKKPEKKKDASDSE